jgi:hypothetical protein
MNDEDYYSRKMRKAEEANALYMKVVFYLALFGLGYAAGDLLVKLWG